MNSLIDIVSSVFNWILDILPINTWKLSLIFIMLFSVIYFFNKKKTEFNIPILALLMFCFQLTIIASISAYQKKTIYINSRGLTTTQVKNVFFEFINAWNEKNYQKQVSLMSNNFIYLDNKKSMNYYQYLQNKSWVFNNCGYINIEVSNVECDIFNENAIVTYHQHYKSGIYESYGVNKFYFKLEDGKIKIYQEVFNKSYNTN